VYYVVPAQGDLAPEFGAEILAGGLGGVPLFPGSHLVGIFTWTKREVLANIQGGVSSVRATPFYHSCPLTLKTQYPAIVYTPDVNGLQTSGISDPRVATVNLFQWVPEVTRVLQDTAGSTAIAGMATFGGFWTFLNDVFALFFGANVLYFLFGKPILLLNSRIESSTGRRPLSALGLVHTFQRRRLVGQWHKDFPAIHTEGGLPGSESAGIVAFIRERLVHLDNDPPATPDIEAQLPKAEDVGETEDTAIAQLPMTQYGHPTYLRLPGRESGYILDEIPLTDVNLGINEILHNSTNFAL
jgi:hypothetical protein